VSVLDLRLPAAAAADVIVTSLTGCTVVNVAVCAVDELVALEAGKGAVAGPLLGDMTVSLLIEPLSELAEAAATAALTAGTEMTTERETGDTPDGRCSGLVADIAASGLTLDTSGVPAAARVVVGTTDGVIGKLAGFTVDGLVTAATGASVCTGCNGEVTDAGLGSTTAGVGFRGGVVG